MVRTPSAPHGTDVSEVVAAIRRHGWHVFSSGRALPASGAELASVCSRCCVHCPATRPPVHLGTVRHMSGNGQLVTALTVPSASCQWASQHMMAKPFNGGSRQHPRLPVRPVESENIVLIVPRVGVVVGRLRLMTQRRRVWWGLIICILGRDGKGSFPHACFSPKSV